MVPVLVWKAGTPLGLALFLLAGFTDLADGYLARRFGWGSQLGSYLDPIADKLMMSSLFVVLAYSGIIPWWLVGIVLGRDLAILLGGLILMHFTRLRVFPPTVAGKLSTFVQIVTVGCAMAGFSNEYFWYLTAALAFGSAAQYCWLRVRELPTRTHLDVD